MFTDWFTDVLVTRDCHYSLVWDLDDLAEASEIGLISLEEMRQILQLSAKVVRWVEEGQFPLESMRAAKEVIRDSGIARGLWSAV